MKKYWAVIFVILCTAVLGITACQNPGGEPETKENGAEDEEKVFGDFETQTLDGERVNQEIFEKSGLTMVNVWATFCGPCINEMPDLGELSRSYEQAEFQIVGLISDVMEPEDESACSIVEETGANYVHLTASEDLMNGVLKKINVVPTTIFVDRNGEQVGGVYAGSKSMEDWRQIIDKHLDEVQ